MRAEGRNPRRLTSTFGLLTSDTRTGAVAQLGEHLLCKQGVVGSIPISSTRSVRSGRHGRDEMARLPIGLYEIPQETERVAASISGESNSGLRSPPIFAIQRSLTIEYGL
jgi:hypothetical protein